MLVLQALAQIQREAERPIRMVLPAGETHVRGPKISKTVLVQALRDAGVARDDDIVKVVDCRFSAKNPQRPHEAPHCGSWPGWMMACQKSMTIDFYHAFIHEYAEALQEAARKPVSEPPCCINIFFYCNRGHHRCVAAATILQHHMETTDGCLRSEVVHCCQTMWWKGCGYCQEPT